MHKDNNTTPMLFRLKKISRTFFLFIVIPIFYGLSVGEEIPTKLYYLDTKYVEVDEWKQLTQGMNINLIAEKNDYWSLFNFKQPKKEIKIYYDSSFTKLAVNIILTLKDQTLAYQFFDKTGNLRKEYFKQNGNFLGKYRLWYPDNILAQITYYEKHEQKVYDSLFYQNKNLWQVQLYYDNKPYKLSLFHKTGKLDFEYYKSIDPKTNLDLRVFQIEYDSLTGKPKMFYVKENVTELGDDNPGVMVTCDEYISVDSAKIIKSRH